jgi:hypothetical protein
LKNGIFSAVLESGKSGWSTHIQITVKTYMGFDSDWLFVLAYGVFFLHDIRWTTYDLHALLLALAASLHTLGKTNAIRPFARDTGTDAI